MSSAEQEAAAGLRKSMQESRDLVLSELRRISVEGLGQMVDRLAEADVTLTDEERIELRACCWSGQSSCNSSAPHAFSQRIPATTEDTMHGTFLYYLPLLTLGNTGRPTRQQLEERGLWDRLDDCCTGQLATEKAAFNAVTKGPDGRGGLIIVPMPHDDSTVDATGYYPERQKWEQSERGDYWIGVDTINPPTPEGLVRRETVAGYEHELGDGHLWTCPTIRRAMFLPAVPCSYAKTRDGITRNPLPQYATIFQRSLQFAAQYAAGEAVPLERQWEFSVACLALNYRVGDEEVSLLSLLNDRTIVSIMDAAFDMPWLREAMEGTDPQKKRIWDSVSAALASSVPGETASSPVTSQPSPT